MPLFSFYTSLKHHELLVLCFKGIYKNNGGMKRVNQRYRYNTWFNSFTYYGLVQKVPGCIKKVHKNRKHDTSKGLT